MKKGKTLSYKFGIKTTSKLSDAPGPGAYEPNIHSARERVHTYKMGTSQR
jgi:hypothetical protein